MSKRMLIDGTHPEELRVVVSSGTRLEEFDVETSTKKQLKGNIYLAKVTRVEPSLQAAFVDYGGNRHGFLAFNEIHPDYYQIPIEDRRALMEEHAALELNAMAAQAHVEEIDGEIRDTDEVREAEEREGPEDLDETDDEDGAASVAPATDETRNGAGEVEVESEQGAAPDMDADGGLESSESETGASVRKRSHHPRRYKIQEVIRRRQILLVQVVKEERGNKGAALTTYISLAGRYCVLMPNTGRGGGISRKVTNASSRRKLRDILNSLGIPEGMGVIMRTAGMERNKSEIKRDFEYLLRTWDNIRELTLKSTAPTLIYEEASLIKRAIRDIYTKDIDEVLVEGNDPYQTAKKFMRLLMPSHAKRVQPYRDDSIPLFHRYQVESQLDAMLDPIVQLKSGGYIVIHSTEALVAVDVNSGRSTRERNIEETALKTNIEAAHEIARQLRLRDLAGLIVIDFIDMEVPRNLRKVEKALKDAMAADRARIQIGRISTFGLLELSRQRLRPSLQEASTEVCPHCAGMGYVRSTESMAVRVLRALEEEGIRQRSSEVAVRVPTSVALYILNRKRANLVSIEHRYGFGVSIEGDDEIAASEFTLQRAKARASDGPGEPAARGIETAGAGTAREEAEDEPDREAEPGGSRRSRRRRKSRKAEEDTVQAKPGVTEAPEAEAETAIREAEAAPGEQQEKSAAKRRRRGRRGGRRRSRRSQDAPSTTPHEDAIEATFAWARELASAEPVEPDGHASAIAATFAWAKPCEKPAPKAVHHPGVASDSPKSPEPETPPPAAPGSVAPCTSEPGEREAREDHRRNGESHERGSEIEDGETMPPTVVSEKPKRRGWWQRFSE